MQILRAMLLGLIQGFSEFMPVSSSGNLYFFSNLFNKTTGIRAPVCEIPVFFFSMDMPPAAYRLPCGFGIHLFQGYQGYVRKSSVTF